MCVYTKTVTMDASFFVPDILYCGVNQIRERTIPLAYKIFSVSERGVSLLVFISHFIGLVLYH